MYNTIPDETIDYELSHTTAVLQPYAVTCSKYWWPEFAPTSMFPFAIIMQESWPTSEQTRSPWQIQFP